MSDDSLSYYENFIKNNFIILKFYFTIYENNKFHFNIHAISIHYINSRIQLHDSINIIRKTKQLCIS